MDLRWKSLWSCLFRVLSFAREREDSKGGEILLVETGYARFVSILVPAERTVFQLYLNFTIPNYPD